jgi:PAS domain S-box-containing protein
MKIIKSGNITQKLVMSFCLLIMILISYGLVSFYETRSISDLTRTIYDHPLVVSNAALQSNISILRMHRHMKDVVLFDSPSKVQNAIDAVDQQEKEVYKYLDIVRDNILGGEGKRLEKEARNLFERWKPIRGEVIRLVHQGRRFEAAEITIGKGARHVDDLEDEMVALTNYAREKATSFIRETEETHSRVNLATIIYLISGIVLASLVAFVTLKGAAAAEQKLQESEKRYRLLIESQVDLVSRFSPDGELNFVNNVFCDFFNKTKEELIGSRWQPLMADDDPKFIEERLSKLSPENPTAVIENRLFSGKGDIHWMQFINKGFFDADGTLLEIQSVGRDITERKQAEKTIKRSLQEKEVLLREIHHRVKNNMQIIQSLLNIQADKVRDPAVKKVLVESNTRIKSMALIHETLYRSPGLAKLDVGDYFNQIVDHLFRLYRNPSQTLTLSVEVDPITMDMDYCIACGLIINELISNALKYAFIDLPKGSLVVGLHRVDGTHARLSVSDTGVGFPDTIDLQANESMGLKIVRILVEGQLKGTMTLSTEGGTSFHILFPLQTTMLGGSNA